MPTYTAAIKYDGTDITSSVLFADAEFVSNVNGNPGSCRFRVRDPNHSLSFAVGKMLSLEIDGTVEWTGFVSKVGRQTAFPYGPASQTIFWVIDGVDINILFRRRGVYKKTDPKDIAGKSYKYSGTPTADTTALADLFSTHLDLTGDGIDTSTLVTNVADINVDQTVNAFAGGWTWEQAMNSINSLPAAVYYINPAKKLIWADVDTESAPFGLSDTPDGVTTYGYREMELVYDGSSLVNDFIAWGAGAGSNQMVSKRLISNSSVADHGLWQASLFKTDIYKQSSIDRVADSVVNGSPSSKRGRKIDKVSVTCATFQQGLQAGMAVSFTCGEFGFTDVLPIRQCKITFPAPDSPRFDLLLSHEVDSPWGFYDVFYPKVANPWWASLGSWFTYATGGQLDDFTNRELIYGTTAGYPIVDVGGYPYNTTFEQYDLHAWGRASSELVQWRGEYGGSTFYGQTRVIGHGRYRVEADEAILRPKNSATGASTSEYGSGWYTNVGMATIWPMVLDWAAMEPYIPPDDYYPDTAGNAWYQYNESSGSAAYVPYSFEFSFKVRFINPMAGENLAYPWTSAFYCGDWAGANPNIALYPFLQYIEVWAGNYNNYWSGFSKAFDAETGVRFRIKIDIGPDTLYEWEGNYYPDYGEYTGYIKYWPADETEPANWDYTWTDSRYGLRYDWRFFMQAYQRQGTPTVDGTGWIDYGTEFLVSDLRFFWNDEEVL